MSKTILNNQDLDLKNLCKALFEDMGYCSYYEIQLRSKSYIDQYKTHDISDIDVLGIRFENDLTYSKIGSECKSGDTSALDELYKFYGVSKYSKLNQAYFIKSKIHTNARLVSEELKVRSLSEADIRRMLIGNEYDPDKIRKIEQAKYLKNKDIVKWYSTRNKKLVDYIKYEFWNKESWRNIHNLIHLLQVSNKDLFSENNIHLKEKYMSLYVIELFSISLLKLINNSITLNYSDFRGSLLNNLYGGSESLNERRKMFDIVNQIKGTTENFAAPWEENLLEMSERFADKTKFSSKIPNFLNMIREYFFYKSDIKIVKKRTNLYDDLTRKFSQDLIFFFTQNRIVPEKTFEELMKI